MDDIKRNEILQLRKLIEKEKDPEQLSKLQRALNILVIHYENTVPCILWYLTRMNLFIQTQQQQTEQIKDKKKKIHREWKKQQEEQVAQGKKPFYLKKCKYRWDTSIWMLNDSLYYIMIVAMQRKMEYVEKYKELQGKNNLKKFMAKKLAKNAKKDHRFLPYQRRSANNNNNNHEEDNE